MCARHSRTPRNSWPCPPWLATHEAPQRAWKREPPGWARARRKIIAGVNARACTRRALTRESSRLVSRHGHGPGFLASLCCTYYQPTIYSSRSIARAHTNAYIMLILLRNSSKFAEVLIDCEWINRYVNILADWPFSFMSMLVHSKLYVVSDLSVASRILLKKW